MLVLKTTESSFENFYKDEYRTLPDVSDRIFSTSVDCSYTFSLPSLPLSLPVLKTLEKEMKFDGVFRSMERTTLEVFAEHDSASVQATLYIMAGKILEDNKVLDKVTYKLPNKVCPRLSPPSTVSLSLFPLLSVRISEVLMLVIFFFRGNSIISR